MYLAENIRYLRESVGESQAALGAVIGVEKSTVHCYEAGKTEPSLKTVTMIAQKYGVTLDELVLKRLTPAEPMHVPNLRFLRKRYELSQESMAKLLKVNQSTYANYEAGRRDMSIEQLLKLSEFFGVTLDQLVKTDLTGGEGQDE